MMVDSRLDGRRREPLALLHVASPQLDVGPGHREGLDVVIGAPTEPRPKVAGVVGPSHCSVAAEERGDRPLGLFAARRDDGGEGVLHGASFSQRLGQGNHAS